MKTLLLSAFKSLTDRHHYIGTTDIPCTDERDAPEVIQWKTRTFQQVHFTPGQPGTLTYQEVTPYIVADNTVIHNHKDWKYPNRNG